MIDSLREAVFKDFWLKLFSLALAVMFWLAVNLAINKDVTPAQALSLEPPIRRVVSDLPVVIMSSAEDVRSFSVNPKTVEVTVQGDRKAIERLQPKDVHAMVDLTGIGAAHDLRKRIEVSTPAGVTHVKVDLEEV